MKIWFLKINFLVKGNIIKNPIIYVAKPGIISNKAAKAIAAPDIISYAGNSFFINCVKPDLRVFKPSYLAYIIPSKAVINGIAARQSKVIAAVVLVMDHINVIIAVPKPIPPIIPDIPTLK